MRIAIQINNYANLGKSTTSIAKQAIAMNLDVYFYQVSDLAIQNCRVFTTGKKAQLDFDRIKLQKKEQLELDSFNLILMRNDSPFDMQYITATYILERCRASVINNPCSIRNFPEKFIDYKEYIPKTLISQNFFYIKEFCSQVYPFIVKPLYDFGGSSVAKFNSFCKSAQDIYTKVNIFI